MSTGSFVCPNCGEPWNEIPDVCPMCGHSITNRDELLRDSAERFPLSPALDLYCFTLVLLMSLVMMGFAPAFGAVCLLVGLPLFAMMSNYSSTTLRRFGPDDPRAARAAVIRLNLKVFAVLSSLLLSVAVAFFCVCLTTF